MRVLATRQLFILATITSVVLMGFSFYLQHAQGLEPCPICVSQRIVFTLLGVTSLLASLQNPEALGIKIYSLLTAVFGAAGAGLAIRQLWIQHLPPDQAPNCMPGLEYLVDILPPTDLLRVMLTGTGDCATVQWVFLGLSIPGWTLIAFTGFTLMGLFLAFRKPHTIDL
ncbi:disulfide bond formation protein B [Candidatus Sororendozoicomonas aggregata]|uniref:disulfide bond formation protein B n=1 Tax=Candidatus Sororendozoicomonas aggregata TaxID=3073239 RepID=UPI002ED56BAD